jgi:hypothetical protein
MHLMNRGLKHLIVDPMLRAHKSQDEPFAFMGENDDKYATPNHDESLAL